LDRWYSGSFFFKIGLYSPGRPFNRAIHRARDVFTLPCPGKIIGGRVTERCGYTGWIIFVFHPRLFGRCLLKVKQNSIFPKQIRVIILRHSISGVLQKMQDLLKFSNQVLQRVPVVASASQPGYCRSWPNCSITPAKIPVIIIPPGSLHSSNHRDCPEAIINLPNDSNAVGQFNNARSAASAHPTAPHLAIHL
jgi:hypothetical protein